MNWIALAAFFVVGCTEAAPLPASARRTEAEASVNMSNIDVSSEVGADRLLRRIRDAAKASCDIDKAPPGEGMVARRQSCMYAAMANDVAGVESPVVLARFRRVGASMISAATPQDGVSSNRHALNHRDANADHAANSLTAATSRGLTSDQLNNRESARLRAMGSAKDQGAPLISQND